MKDSTIAGPASPIASPRMTKIPVPMMAPRPSAVRSNRPIARRRPPSSSAMLEMSVRRLHREDPAGHRHEPPPAPPGTPDERVPDPSGAVNPQDLPSTRQGQTGTMARPAIDPVVWQPPVVPPRVKLHRSAVPLPPLRVLDVVGHGPEDVLVDLSGHIVTGVADGRLLRLSPDGRHIEVIADTGGRPLGLEWLPTGRCWSATPGGDCCGSPATWSRCWRPAWPSATTQRSPPTAPSTSATPPTCSASTTGRASCCSTPAPVGCCAAGSARRRPWLVDGLQFANGWPSRRTGRSSSSPRPPPTGSPAGRSWTEPWTCSWTTCPRSRTTSPPARTG